MITMVRSLIFHDFWLKLFSLALAVLIWLTISFAIREKVSPIEPLTLSGTPITFHNLPVMVMTSASDARNFKVIPNEVEVTVQGAASTLQRLQSKDIRAIVDLSGIRAAGDLGARVEVSTPPGVTFVRVQPREVRVFFPLRN